MLTQFYANFSFHFNSLSTIFMHVGNVKELILSGNEIASTQGLDRLFSLEHLSLDNNKIRHLSDISSLAKLPFLMNLDIKGNPFENAGEFLFINVTMMAHCILTHLRFHRPSILSN